MFFFFLLDFTPSLLFHSIVDEGCRFVENSCFNQCLTAVFYIIYYRGAVGL